LVALDVVSRVVSVRAARGGGKHDGDNKKVANNHPGGKGCGAWHLFLVFAYGGLIGFPPGAWTAAKLRRKIRLGARKKTAFSGLHPEYGQVQSV